MKIKLQKGVAKRLFNGVAKGNSPETFTIKGRVKRLTTREMNKPWQILLRKIFFNLGESFSLKRLFPIIRACRLL